MSKDTAPLLPVQRAHWSFSDDTADRLRRLQRRQLAVAQRAQREVQSILGAVLYEKMTGHKPVLTSAKRSTQPVARLTLADLL